MKRLLLAAVVCLLADSVEAQRGQTPPFRVAEEGTVLASRPILNFVGTSITCAVDGVRITCTLTGGGVTDASYWVGAAHAGLSAEINLGALGTGLVINTAGTPSAYAGTSCTNQFPRALNASGAATCVSVSVANDVTGTLAIGNGGTGQTTATAAFDALDPLTTRGDFLTHDGTNSIRRALPGYAASPWSDGTDLTTRQVQYMCCFVAAGGFNTDSTTYVNVTGLTHTLPANNIFYFVCYGTFSSNVATNGIGMSINGTGGTGQAAVYTLYLQSTARNTAGNNTTSTTPFSIRNENTFDSMTALASVISTGSLIWKMEGFYYTGTSGGSTFAVRVRSETAAGNSVNIEVGSGCTFNRQA